MAQNFWTAIDALHDLLVVTIVVSLMTRPRDDRELRRTRLLADRTSARWSSCRGISRPAILGVVVLLATAALNLVLF